MPRFPAVAPATRAVRTSFPWRATAIAVGVALDRRFGEPPLAVHPVARFGQAMTRLEAALYRDDRKRGLVHAGLGVSAAVVVGIAARRLVGPGPSVALATAAVVAGRMLGDEANAIGTLLVNGDLDGARERLPSLVGRSPAGLSASEITRAVVESVAENSIDAVVAPVFWAFVGGAPAACAHRAINTLDAMVGHRSDRYRLFGWASARLDDAANWIPARIGAICVALVHPSRAGDVWRIVGRDAPQHPSPNGGVIESAFAASMGIRLGGENRYGDVLEQRGVLGDGRAADPGDIARSVELLRAVTWAAVGSIAIAEVAVSRARRARLRRHSMPLASEK